MVEHDLAKVGVAGSNPVSRSTPSPPGSRRRTQVAQGDGLQIRYSPVQIRPPPPPSSRGYIPRHWRRYPGSRTCPFASLTIAWRRFAERGGVAPDLWQQHTGARIVLLSRCSIRPVSLNGPRAPAFAGRTPCRRLLPDRGCPRAQRLECGYVWFDYRGHGGKPSRARMSLWRLRENSIGWI